MIFFIDTDVAFDIISKREPHFIHSTEILQLAAAGKAKLFISESSIANLLYLSFDIYKIKDAADKLSDLVAACELLVSGKQNILHALQSSFKDKEDALQYYTASNANLKYFITRNIKDYKYGTDEISVFTSTAFLEFFENQL